MNYHELKTGGRISKHLAPEDISEGNIHDAASEPTPYHLAAFDGHGNLKTSMPIAENDVVRKIDITSILSETISEMVSANLLETIIESITNILSETTFDGGLFNQTEEEIEEEL